MIPINHLLVLSQPEFVRPQLQAALRGRRSAFWELVKAPRL
jgi:hypothetical protein